MKRNFLLMLLMTLLPLAGWAIDVTVGDYTVPVDKQIIAVGDAAPKATGKISKDAQEWTALDGGIVDASKNKVVNITTAGFYYKVFYINLDDAATKTVKFLVPFYAGEKLTTERVNDETSFNKSLATGVYGLYYQKYPWCDVWYAGYGETVPQGVIDYTNGTEGSSKTAVEAWILFPNQTPTADGKTGAGMAVGTGEGKLTTAEATTWYNDLKAGPYGSKIDRSWYATHYSNPDNFTVKYAAGDAGYNVAFSDGNKVDYIEELVDPTLPAEGNNIKKSVTTEDGGWWVVSTASWFSPEAWDQTKVFAIKVPTTVDDLRTLFPVAPEPENFSRVSIQAIPFSVPFGTNTEDLAITPDMLTIRVLGGLQMTDQQFADWANEDGHITFEQLEAGTSVRPTGYRYKLTWDGTQIEQTISNVTTYYDVIFLNDQSTMYITATPNSFLADQAPVTVEGDLIYTGEPQNLIASAGKTAFEHQGDNASKSNVKYLVVTADKVKPANDPSAPVVPVEPVQPEPGQEPGQAEEVLPEEYGFADGYTPAASEWKDEATATDVGYAGEGESRAQSPYYVFAKATEGIGDAEGWTEGEVVYVGAVMINKATPVLEMAGIDPQYYLKSRSTETNGLHKALTPEVTVKVASGKEDTEGNPIYNTLTAGKEYKAEDISVVVCTKPSFNPQYYLQNFKCSTVGEYRITSAIAANDNLNELGIGPSYGFVDFTVVRPKVTVTATATDVPYNNAPTFGYTVSNWEGDFTEFVVGDPVYTLYDANGNEVHKEGINGSEGYPSGTWTVKVSGLRVVSTVANPDADPAVEEVAGDHVITYVDGSITIGKADIVAKVADQNLIYGQALPVKLQHVDGLTGQSAATTFEAETDWTFNATLVDATTHEPILDDKGKEQVKVIESGNLLDAGTYRVTCSGQTFSMPGALNQFNVIAGAGYWTVAPKNLDNSDSRFNQNVNNIQNFWNPQNRPSVTYTGEPVLPILSVITYNGKALEANVPATYYVEGDKIPEGKKVGDEKTAEVEKDYSIEVISAGGNIHAANNVQIRLTGHGNYTGTRTLAYNINKKAIPVKPANAEWVCGSDEVVDGKSIYEIDWAYVANQLVSADYDAWVVAEPKEGEDAYKELKKQNGFKDLAVRRPTGPNVGTFDNGIEAYLPSGKSVAQDYDFTPGTGKVVITPGTIALKVNPNMTAVYAGKGAYPLTEGELVLDEANSTLGAFYVQDDNWKQLVKSTATLTWTYPQLTETVTRFNVGDKYTISIAVDQNTNMSSTNYEIVITPDEEGGDVASADVTITPADVTLTSANQGGDNGYAFDQLAELFQTGIDQVSAVGIKGEDAMTDLVATTDNEGNGAVSYPATVTAGNNPEVIDINTKTNNNYNVTKEKGDLKIAVAADLVLYSNMLTEYETVDGKQQVKGELGDQDKIIKYNGLPTNSVTLYLKAPKLTTQKDGVDTENENFKVWKANDWHAMVLPFAIKARDLSNQLGYAVINVVDPAKTEKDNVRFTLINLSKEIPANTPFCVKTDEDFNFTNALQFGSETAPVTIVQPEAWKVAEDAGMGYTFVGTYEEAFVIDNTQDYLRFLGPNKWYYVSKAGTKYTMQPYNAYVDLSTSSEARNVTFTFEEEDGSTTAIKAVDFMNGKSANAEGVYRVDGVKMNTVPTQKGVYIQNGKKYVK